MADILGALQAANRLDDFMRGALYGVMGNVETPKESDLREHLALVVVYALFGGQHRGEGAFEEKLNLVVAVAGFAGNSVLADLGDDVVAVLNKSITVETISGESDEEPVFKLRDLPELTRELRAANLYGIG